MKKAISNLTAVVLLFCLILGNIPVGIVYGAESGQSGDSTMVSSEDNKEVSDMDGKMIQKAYCRMKNKMVQTVSRKEHCRSLQEKR